MTDCVPAAAVVTAVLLLWSTTLPVEGLVFTLGNPII
jgi:hypothetical protein